MVTGIRLTTIRCCSIRQELAWNRSDSSLTSEPTVTRQRSMIRISISWGTPTFRTTASLFPRPPRFQVWMRKQVSIYRRSIRSQRVCLAVATTTIRTIRLQPPGGEFVQKRCFETLSSLASQFRTTNCSARRSTE